MSEGVLPGVAVLFVLLVIYAATSRKLESLGVTGPMVFLGAGFLLGPSVLSLFDPEPATELTRIAAELTLVLLLFSDAATVDVDALRGQTRGPARLLLLALPLAIVLGTAAGWLLLPGITLGVAALLASMLAATDLSLGLAMFKNPEVPARVRRTLNIESGLNDGIATPFVTLFLGLAVAEVIAGGRHWLVQSGAEIAVGVAVGLAVGVLGGRLVRTAAARDWCSRISLQYAVLALALLSYGLAGALDGNTFLAAFVGGLAYRWTARQHAVESTEFAEQTGTLMTLIIWAVFGAVVGNALVSHGLDWRPIVYAIISLTVVRMVAVAISLLRSGAHWETHVFVGWFGPRGLASVVFLLVAADALSAEGADTRVLVLAAGWTIVLSVILHGVSAQPLGTWYGRRTRHFSPDAPELAEQTRPADTRREGYRGRHERWHRRGVESPSASSDSHVSG